MITLQAIYKKKSAKILFHAPALSLIALALTWCFFVFDDYGISWDELQQQKVGKYTYEYIAQESDSLIDFKDRVYGPIYETGLIAVQKACSIHDYRDIYLSRHLANHLFFLLGLCFLYLIGIIIFEKRIPALLLALLVYSTPRIFGHSFINSKDIPFLVMYIISTYAVLTYLKKTSYATLIFVSISCALLVCFRIPGIIIPLLFAALLIFKSVQNKKLDYIKHLLIFTTITIAGTYAFWPYLWQNPIPRFVESFKTMSAFPWEDFVLFEGNYYPGPRLPHHYLFKWFYISVPIFYLIVILAGLGSFIYLLAKHFIRFFHHDLKILFLILSIIGPITAVILFRSIVYDDWRHLYFIYPNLLLISIWSILGIITYKKIRALFFTTAFLAVSFSIVQIIKLHPYQQTFFNAMAGKNPAENYDIDYWGSSYKQALEWISSQYPHSKVCVAHNPGIYNYNFLNNDARSKIALVDYTQMEYFVTTHRFEKNLFPEMKMVHEEFKNGVKIFTIYKK